LKLCTQCKARFTGNPSRCPLDGAPLVDLPDPLIGRTIGGRYRVEAKIGSGGMAAVYRASHDMVGRKVAIKFLSPDLALDPTQKERFLREARATNRIRQENIVDITDYGEEEPGLVYLVMELLEGETLSRVIARGPISPPETVDILAQVGRALARAHELEVVHRDIKPENIFLVHRLNGPLAKLLDFGLAHVRTEARLTATGAVFGTPEYMSPEQARGAPIGPASDLYSLGVVFFEMLTSRLPFEGSTAELIVKHVRAQPPAPSTFVRTLPAEFDQCIATMLTKDPTKRHRDAHHLIEDLLRLRALYPQPSILPTPVMGIDQPLVSTAVGYASLPGEPETMQSDEHPTAVPVSIQSWMQRRAVFREALKVAYPDVRPPPWVLSTVDRMEKSVESAAAADREMKAVAKELAERETAASDSRERIGRALDELARDESVVVRQVEDLERRSERLLARGLKLMSEFQRAWLDATSVVQDGVLPNVDAANLVEAAARRATAWRQAVQEIDELRAVLQSRRTARDDLRFQVASLKGRLGAMNAEVEMELNAMREKASELGAALAQTNEELADSGAALAAHLGEIPAARPMIAQSLRGHQAAS